MPWCGAYQILGETLVRREEDTGFRRCQSPKPEVGDSLVGSAANIQYLMPERPKSIHRHSGNVLIDKDAHPLGIGNFDRCDLLLGQAGGIV